MDVEEETEENSSNKTDATAKGGLALPDPNFDKLCDLVKQKNFKEERISLQCKCLTRSFLFTQFLSNFAATNAYKYAKMGLINIEEGHIFLNEDIKNKEIERKPGHPLGSKNKNPRKRAEKPKKIDN